METAGARLAPAVTKIRGEPAILITGLPNPTPKPNPEPKSKPESEPEPDPCFGEWLEGRKVSKLFGDSFYSGKVISYDKEENWYRVEYEDGDLEDLDWYELEEVLIPLDISIPLKNLALNLGKWDSNINTASKSGLKRGRARKESFMTGTAGLESGISDLALVPVKMENFEQEESLVSKNSKRGRKPKGNIGNKKEEKLVVASVKGEVQSGVASRRKREGKRRESMNTAKAERQKRKEQQSHR